MTPNAGGVGASDQPWAPPSQPVSPVLPRTGPPTAHAPPQRYPGYPPPGYPPVPGYPPQGYPGYPPPARYPFAPAPTGPREGSSPSDPLHWIVPIGRSWQSILAGYLGLAAVLLPPVSPFAIWAGTAGLLAARRGGHGRGRAVTGIVGGVLGLAVGVLWLASWR